jgi:hypothetical protein
MVSEHDSILFGGSLSQGPANCHVLALDKALNRAVQTESVYTLLEWNR